MFTVVASPPRRPRPCFPRLSGRLSLAFLLALLVVVGGCKKDKDAKDSVSGKVSYKGSPVSGIVVFVGGDGKEASSPINPDGSYSVPNPPQGQVKILVKGMAAPKGLDKQLPKDAPQLGPGSGPGGAAPPEKYSKTNTSDLTFEVKTGKQTHDIELK